jgi:hypothetical protein
VLRFSLNGAGESVLQDYLGHGRGRRIPNTQRHRGHDELVSELGLWYTRSVPEMGYYVEEWRFGFYQRQKDSGPVRAILLSRPSLILLAR